MTESFNKIELSGKVAEIISRTGLTKKNVNYVSGTIKIETGPDNIIPVEFFAQEINSKGTASPLYKSLLTVKDEYKSIAADGREAADTIVVESAKLTENLYSPEGETIRRGFKINSSFFNRKKVDVNVNRFTVEGEVVVITDEIKADVPTGSVIVELLITDFNKNAHVVSFYVDQPKSAEYVKNTFSIGDQVKVVGKIIISEEDIVKVEKAAFGDDIEQHTKRVTRRLVIESSSAPVASTITNEERETMLATREADIQKKKAEAKAKTGGSSTGGFSL
jgi:hypothetical protein